MLNFHGVSAEKCLDLMIENESLYDSTGTPIYEPIQSRPPSQMSNRSNYSSSASSMYYPYLSTKPSNSSNLRTQMPSHSQPATRPATREAEVDHLTDLLVQSMDASANPEFFGMCSKCGQKVLGEGSGCTAMNQVYHITCFTCSICHCRLQGKPFYAVNAKPYCEEDYLNTLEKCSVCTKPILDRILRATGKPYHPTCFTCVVCNKSLDGVPFTVDATNQIHCIDDFHKKFAPRCCVCSKPIMPEPGQEETVRVVALDRSFHIQCYRCEDCGILLSSEAEGRGCYPLDEHILCKQCNANRVQTLTSKMATEL
ncbi:Lipoma-preferred partner [Nymphon striatum]|nr:Lipoma-preferred partner [Nymphon striatum]